VLYITTTPGSTVESKGSMLCMIGGAGNLPSKMARTKSIPAIAAMTSVGVTPYSILAVVRSSMGIMSCGAYNDGNHIINLAGAPASSCPDLIRASITLQEDGLPGQARQ
jgi:hypothetical protein